MGAQWQSGEPKRPGTYLVAISYENGLGTIGASNYHPKTGWQLKEDSIIAHLSVQDVLDSAGIDWPEHLTPQD